MQLSQAALEIEFVLYLGHERLNLFVLLFNFNCASGVEKIAFAKKSLPVQYADFKEAQKDII
jgi:hypothetical protein